MPFDLLHVRLDRQVCLDESNNPLLMEKSIEKWIFGPTFQCFRSCDQNKDLFMSRFEV